MYLCKCGNTRTKWYPRCEACAHRRYCAIPLTAKQREVLNEILTGAPQKEVANRLGLSQKTISSQKLYIMRKLNAHSDVELTVVSIRLGYLSLTDFESAA